MKVAIVGSRSLNIRDFSQYLIGYDLRTLTLVSGGAKGIDSCVREWAQSNKISLHVFVPDHARYGQRAPLVRNDEIIAFSDAVIAFWDGAPRGTAYTIRPAEAAGKPVTVIYL